MADVMSAFLQGHQFAQAESQHQQQLEENKLRTLVLKHEIDRMKIDDQIRARDLSKQNLDLLHGQPAADIPSDAVTTATPNLPSRNLAGVVQGLIQGGQGQGVESGAPAPVTSSTPPSMPSTIPAPGAQAPETLTHPETAMVPRAVQIPGVDAFGGAPAIPGVSVRPRSMEDVIRAQIAAEMAKPYTLKDDESRMLGNQVVAKGGGKKVIVPRGGTLVDENNPAQPLAVGQPAAKRSRPVAGTLNGKPVYAVFDQDTERYTVGGEDVTATFKPLPRASADAETQRQHMNDWREYTAEQAAKQKAHAEAFRAWQTKTTANPAMPGEETPPPEAPAFQSFEDWKAVNKPAGDAAAAKGGAPKKGDTKPIDGYPGTEQTFDGTKWIRTK
jgi:hypothetical protein